MSRQKVQYFAHFFPGEDSKGRFHQINIGFEGRTETGYLNIPPSHTTKYDNTDRWNKVRDAYSYTMCTYRVIGGSAVEVTRCKAKKILRDHPLFAQLKFPMYVDEVRFDE